MNSRSCFAMNKSNIPFLEPLIEERYIIRINHEDDNYGMLRAVWHGSLKYDPYKIFNKAYSENYSNDFLNSNIHKPHRPILYEKIDESWLKTMQEYLNDKYGINWFSIVVYDFLQYRIMELDRDAEFKPYFVGKYGANIVIPILAFFTKAKTLEYAIIYDKCQSEYVKPLWFGFDTICEKCYTLFNNTDHKCISTLGI